MSSKLVEFYTESGDVVHYRPLSVRLAEFLAQYGPDKGYAVVTEIQDSLSLKPGLLRLYEVAIQAGRRPEELGLPSPILAGQTQVCRATLLDEAGRLVASATAAKHIQQYKDLEVLETAARQRLLAALGFGGEAFDSDEVLDQHDQGLKTVDSAPRQPIDPAPVVSHTPSAAPSTEDTALAMLQRQITHLARIKGVEVPVVTTQAEARETLKRLMQAQVAASAASAHSDGAGLSLGHGQRH